MGHQSYRTLGGMAVCSAALLLADVQASGFALIEQSVSAMGSGYAGGAAQATDATTLYFNPAGMVRLPGARLNGGLHVVIPEASFTNQGSTLALGGDIVGNDGGDAGVTGFVPHSYLTYQVSDAAWFGMAVNVPFGLGTEYDPGWVGRYHALKSEVLTLNLNPSFAFKLNDRLSVGLGVSYQYIHAEITNALDLGTLDNFLAMGGAPAQLTPGDPAVDGKVTLEGDDWSWGWNMGLLFEYSEDTRAGLHYRSAVKHTLACCAKYRIPSAALAADNIAEVASPGGALDDTTVNADIELPASLSASLYHRISPAWAVMGDVTWTDWSSVPELRFQFGNPVSDGVLTLDWEDSYRYALGVEHTPPGRWTFRGGVALDETPIPNAERRTPRVPGADRLWLTLGLGYRPSTEWQFDLGYAHIFIDDPKIAKKAPSQENFRRGFLNGSYAASVDIISAQAEWRFR